MSAPEEPCRPTEWQSWVESGQPTLGRTNGSPRLPRPDLPFRIRPTPVIYQCSGVRPKGRLGPSVAFMGGGAR